MQNKGSQDFEGKGNGLGIRDWGLEFRAHGSLLGPANAPTGNAKLRLLGLEFRI